MIKILNENELILLKKACEIVKEAHILGESLVCEGVTTKEIDENIEKFILKNGATPSFKGYHGFPYATCISINNEVVHGKPSNRKLKMGDIVSIDIGACYKGYHGDAARSFVVKRISNEEKNTDKTGNKQNILDENSVTVAREKLVAVTRECFFKAIENLKEGMPLNTIGIAVEKYAKTNGYSVVKDMCGHGIGKNLHEDPAILNYNGYAGNGGRVYKNQTLAIEPMINAGGWKIKYVGGGEIQICETLDGSDSAHYENTVLITETGVEILTEDI